MGSFRVPTRRPVDSLYDCDSTGPGRCGTFTDPADSQQQRSIKAALDCTASHYARPNLAVWNPRKQSMIDIFAHRQVQIRKPVEPPTIHYSPALLSIRKNVFCALQLNELSPALGFSGVPSIFKCTRVLYFYSLSAPAYTCLERSPFYAVGPPHAPLLTRTSSPIALSYTAFSLSDSRPLFRDVRQSLEILSNNIKEFNGAVTIILPSRNW